LKTIVIALVGVLGGGAVAAGLFFFVFKPGDSGPVVEPTAVAVPGKLGPHITLAARVFNLRSEPGKPPVYLKLETLIEFETTEASWARVLRGCVEKAGGSPCKAEEAALLHEFDEEIGTGRRLIEDAVTTIVSAKTLSEVSSPEGKEKLRAEIMHAVEELIPHPHVVRVLFTDFVTQ
jgi:Flagellar basal body-associated protein FliL